MAVFYDAPSLLNTAKFANWVLRNKGAPRFKEKFYILIRNTKNTFYGKPIRDYIETITRIDEITKSQAFRDFKNQFKNVIKDESGAGMFVESWDRTKYLRFVEVLNRHLNGTPIGQVLQKHLAVEQAKTKPAQKTVTQATLIHQEAEEKQLSKEEINRTLKDYQKTSKKEVKYTEKTHPPTSPEAVKKLDELVGVKSELSQKLVEPSEKSTKPAQIISPAEPLIKPSSYPPVLVPPSIPLLKPTPPKPIPPGRLVGPDGRLLPHLKPIAGGSGETMALPLPSPFPTPSTIPSFPKLTVPSAVKNFAITRLAIPARSLLLRVATPKIMTRLLFGVIGGVVGATGGEMGILIGAGAGVSAPTLLDSRFINPITRGIGSVLRNPPRLGGIGNLGRTASMIGKAAKIGRLAALLANPAGVVVLVIIGVFILIPALFLFQSLIATPNAMLPPWYSTGYAAPPDIPPGGDGDIAGCTFYRGGDSTPGIKFNIPEWPALIDDTATRVQIPGTILAGILRVECPKCFSYSLQELKNDYNADSSGVAYGAMQFVPDTFEGIYNGYSGSLKSLFGKTSFKKTVDPPDAMAPIDVFRIYSIRDSVTAAAFKIKGDKGPGNWNEEHTIRDIASMYFSGRRLTDPKNCTKYPDCNNGPYDYGDDLWKSYSNCRPSSVTPAPTLGEDIASTLRSRFKIAFDSSIEKKYLTWAMEILTESETTTPKFITLFKEQLQKQGYKEINVKTKSGVGERVGNTIYFSTDDKTFFMSGNAGQFKQIFIHELAHVVHGTGRGDPTYTGKIEAAVGADKKFISGYAQGSTKEDVVCEKIDSGERNVQLDEDFADSIAYFINKNVGELNYSNTCPARSNNNPFATNSFPAHAAFMRELLGGNNF